MRSSDFAISQSNGLMNVRLRNTKKNIMEIDLHRASLFRYSAKFYSMEINFNDKFYRKVAFLMYTEMVKFRSQSRETASKRKPYRGLGTR